MNLFKADPLNRSRVPELVLFWYLVSSLITLCAAIANLVLSLDATPAGRLVIGWLVLACAVLSLMCGVLYVVFFWRAGYVQPPPQQGARETLFFSEAHFDDVTSDNEELADDE